MTAYLFPIVEDVYGTRLALVFGNQNQGGHCPYYIADCCLHCDIGAGEGRAFTDDENLERLRALAQHYAADLAEVAHLVLYNSGSTLNPRELSLGVLRAILTWAAELPRLAVISLDTREPYIREDHLAEIIVHTPNQVSLHPILGLESADDAIRNGTLRKRMPKVAIERALTELEACGKRYPGRVGLDINLVVAAPGVADPIEDVLASANYIWQRTNLRVDINLHPYYPSARSHVAFPGTARCSWETAARCATALHQASDAAHERGSIFVGNVDEGHDQQQALRQQSLASWQNAFDAFNASQDPQYLDAPRAR